MTKVDFDISKVNSTGCAMCEVRCRGNIRTVWYVYAGNPQVKRADVAAMVMPLIRDGGLTVAHGKDVDVYVYNDPATVVVWTWELPTEFASGEAAYTIQELSEMVGIVISEVTDGQA